MKRVAVEGIRPADVKDAVGAETFARGRAYVAKGAVLAAEWYDDEGLIEALVAGSGRKTYATTVYFEDDGSGDLELAHGECSCPMGFMCKHVAAVALACSPEGDAGTAAGPSVSWEAGLEALLPRAGAPALTTGPATELSPLALELSLDPGPDGALRVRARMLRPGKRGWIAGNLAWNRTDELRRSRDVREDHVGLVRELHALQQAGSPADPYRFWHPGDQKTIDLTGLTSRRFWAWLDDAFHAGLSVLPARRALGPIEGYRRARMALDVTAGGDGSLAVAPGLFLDDAESPEPDARAVAFIGDHGVVHVSASEAEAELDPLRWRLHLARLDPPVTAEVARAAQRRTAVVVPAEHVERFRTRYGTRLGAATSSDGAFRAPTVSAPTLVAALAYGEAHALEVSWAWSYDLDGTPVRTGCGPSGPDAPFRDPAAERTLLAGLAGLPIDVGRFGFLGASRPVRLAGLDTVAFTTEVVPLLEGADGVRVERTGSPADFREVSDQLEIAVSTAESTATDDGGTDWFDLGVTVRADGQEVPFTSLFTALAAGEDHLLLPDGAYFSLAKPELQTLRSLIEEARALQETPAGPLRVSRFQAGWWEELAALGVVERQADAWREQVGGLLDPGALRATPVPDTVDATLRPYQREGFEWLAFLWRHGLGGVLADDMGLGKTVQALALICHARESAADAAPFLIVAPTSVVANWAQEARRFAPSLEVTTLTDTLRRRGEDLSTAIGTADVVVTSYTLFRLDAEAHLAASWSGALFDEAQFLKNRQSKVYGCARRVPAPFKLAITGTPMENDLMELWSLLSITAPGLFPNPRLFSDTYARPIEKQGDTELLARLRRRVRPLMTRRTKEQVAPDLPPKQQQVLPVDLTPAHRTIYQRHLQRERQKILGMIDDVDRNRFTILQSITRLRQLSLHPALVDDGDAAVGSAKIDALVTQLGELIGTGHRALVFSQFTGFLAHVRDALDSAGIAYAYLDGTTRSREKVIARFKDGDAPVFLISLKAGGFGLTLTEADYCFLLDPWWNPATEAQAIDRTHRIGQQRPVMVYRLIANDTIEEKVRALAERKAELFNGVIDEGEVFARALDADDIRALVS